MLNVRYLIVSLFPFLVLVQTARAAEGEQPKDLQDQIGLAEKQVATKRSLVKVAEAQVKIAEANLKVLKAKVSACQNAADAAKIRLEKAKAIKAVSKEELDALDVELRSKLDLVREAEEKLAVGEAEVALELARRDVAVTELDEAELRLKQLRERAK
jgi:hypothetical protein